ncbi:MAG: hypothetical protein EHM72_16625, partial [Calditrichaeota bacterium]
MVNGIGIDIDQFNQSLDFSQIIKIEMPALSLLEKSFMWEKLKQKKVCLWLIFLAGMAAAQSQQFALLPFVSTGLDENSVSTIEA